MASLLWLDLCPFILMKNYKRRMTIPLLSLRLVYEFSKTLDVFFLLLYDFNKPSEAFCFFNTNFDHEEPYVFPILYPVTI